MATAVASPREILSEAALLHEVASSELGDLCGITNAAHGRMVEVVADALAHDAWSGHGILSPRHWVAWQTGMTDVSAADIVRLATRRGELPSTVAALRNGRLSLASAGLIARYVPGEYELAALDMAFLMTVRQLRRAVSRYHFDLDKPHIEPVPPVPDHAAGTDDGEPEGNTRSEREDSDRSGTGAPSGPYDDGPTTDPTTDPANGPGAGGMLGGRRLLGGSPVEERRDLSSGSDDHDTFWLTAHLPADEGAVVRAALQARRDDLYRQACNGLPDGAPRPKVSLADALVSIAESALAGGAAATPGTDRYLVHAHLTASPAGGNDLQLHLGATLPHHLRELYTCDCNIRPVLEVDGTPANIGRLVHIVSRRLRRLIEHRDGGCTVPGCPRTTGLEIHHIVHWERGGLTTTDNLLTLCRHHHRSHHLGLLEITGNADHPLHSAQGVNFTDRWGRPLRPASTPTPPDPAQPLRASADQVGLQPGHYQHGLGERVDYGAIVFNDNETMTRFGWTDLVPPEPPHGTEPDSPPGAADPDARSGSREVDPKFDG